MSGLAKTLERAARDRVHRNVMKLGQTDAARLRDLADALSEVEPYHLACVVGNVDRCGTCGPCRLARLLDESDDE